MSTQTFWLEPTDEVALGLRRYTYATGSEFTCEAGHHSALVYIGRGAIQVDQDGNQVQQHDVPTDDPRWPMHCDRCGIEFPEDAAYQNWSLRLYRRTDTGDLRVLHETAGAPFAPAAEPGACWDAEWLPDDFHGPDGIALTVRCPGGHTWHVDSRAANCGRPDDSTHACWVRHGDPRECRLTVDKDGDTCSAGAGSILTPNWHGFLRNGELVE